MKKIDFNQGWLFSKHAIDLQTEVALPHDAMLWEKRDANCPNGKNTGYFPGGKYFYTKNFVAPIEWSDMSVIIEFEGVYQRATILLNGEELYFHPYGYTGFGVDLSGRLRFGEKNNVTVIADNSCEPNTRWYSGSGIYRPVWLHVGSKTHVNIDGIKVFTKSFSPAVIQVKTEATGGNALIRIEREGVLIATATGNDVDIAIPNASLWSEERPDLYTCSVELEENGSIVDSQSVNFGICHREWSVNGLFINGKKTLLRGACIHHDNGILGACEFPAAALRRVKILKDSGFNAIRMAHNPVSKALLDACDREGLYVMDEFVDMWYEHKNCFDYATYFEEWYKMDVKAMVNKDISHPSVLMYSIGNEVTETAEPSGIAYTKKMTDICHELDNTRPVTCGINMALNVMHFAGLGVYKPHLDDPIRQPEPKNPKGLALLAQMGTSRQARPQQGDSTDAGMAALGLSQDAGAKKDGKLVGSEYFNQMMVTMKEAQQAVVKQDVAKVLSEDAYAALDIAGYNYAITRYELDAVDYPDRVSVGTETLPQKIYENWQHVTACPYSLGDFIWTGWDYIGESGIGAFCYDSVGTKDKEYPFLLAGSGIIDILGHQRPEVWLNKAVYGLTDKPYIGVEPLTHAHENHIISAWRYSDAVHSWSWAGCEGRNADIVVYCRAPMVELFLNGISLGKKETEECNAKFETIYEKGTLLAVSYDADGNVLGNDELHTGEGKARIEVVPDKHVLCSCGQDLCHLEISLVADDGTVLASSDREVTVNVTGNGTLAGFGNAAPCTEELYTDNVHTTFYGKNLAVIRSGTASGDIYVTVSANDCDDVNLTLEVK